MRFTCDLQLSYHECPSFKPVKTRAQLSLAKKNPEKRGRFSTESSETHYLVIYSGSSKTGSKLRDTRYKLDGNVVELSTKFIAKGMTTIKFREPPHSVSISSGDADEVKKLVRVLENIKIEEPESSDDFESLSSMIPVKLKDIQPNPTSMRIHHKSTYPLTVLPPSLKTFEAIRIELRIFDSRLAQLKNLKKLDLSGNKIKVLPSLINEMALTQLSMADNRLEELPDKFGTGLLAEHLTDLDLSSNEISTLRLDFFGFYSLYSLNLSSNKLTEIHPNLKLFQKLKILKLHRNNLKSLPISIFKLSLDDLDLTSNPFDSDGIKSDHGNVYLPPLFELAFRTLKSNMDIVERFKKVRAIPVVLLKKLENAGIQCPCGKYFYDTFLTFYSQRSLDKLNCNQLALPNHQVTLEIPLCAPRCVGSVRRYQLYNY